MNCILIKKQETGRKRVPFSFKALRLLGNREGRRKEKQIFDSFRGKTPFVLVRDILHTLDPKSEMPFVRF